MDSQPASPQPLRPILIITAGVLIGLLLSALILILTDRPAGTPIALLPSATPGGLLVDVTGSVAKPGLYELAPGSRVADALAAAGGVSPQAQVANLNLASLLTDGQQLYVPSIGETPVPVARATGSYPININTAGTVELSSLPGIGEGRAEDIIAYRQKNGAFDTIDEIMNVPGIGEGIFDQIKDYITVDS